MRISDWSSDVCSSDLAPAALGFRLAIEVAGVLHRPRLDVGDAGVALVAQRGRLKLDPDVRRLLHDDALLPQRLLEGVEDEAAFQAKIGRASCRERGCQYVYISVVAVSLKKKTHHYN